MIGMEEGVFPHSASIEEQGIEEERRLCYVGLTRAKERLTLTHTLSRSLWGARTYNLPPAFSTSFLRERSIASACGRSRGRAKSPAPEFAPRADRARRSPRATPCATPRSARAWSSRIEPGGIVAVRFAGGRPSGG